MSGMRSSSLRKPVDRLILAADRNRAGRRELPDIPRRLVHTRGDVDAGLRCATVHLVGQAYRGTPHVVDEARPAHQSTDHVAGVDADPKPQFVSGLAVEAIDDLAHFQGEFDASVNAVQSRGNDPTAGQIAVVEGANPLDAERFGRRIELTE